MHKLTLFNQYGNFTELFTSVGMPDFLETGSRASRSVFRYRVVAGTELRVFSKLKTKIVEVFSGKFANHPK